MAKNFITHVMGTFGGKRPSRARLPKRLLPRGRILPSYKGFLTKHTKGHRTTKHRANPAIYHRTGNHKHKVFHMGDRIKKGNWSEKRWRRAVKSDEKRDGSRYEHWEMKHGRRGSWNKKTSWI